MSTGGPPQQPHSRGKTLAHVLVPVGAALCCLPFVTTGEGLLAGVVVAVAFGNPYLDVTRKRSHQLLALSVVGLGAGMDLRVVAAVGAHGFMYTLVGISTCLAAGLLLAKALRVPRNLGMLISIGTAICGGSAIAAVVPVLKPKEHEVSASLGTVFVLNAVALFLFPPIGRWFQLSEEQFGLWSALAIHDTSSVVGAAMAYGGRAVEIATTVKLARALWIVPLTLLLALWQRRREPGPGPAGSAKKPWFILGFIAAAALVTFAPELSAAGTLIARVAKQSLVVTLFLIGTGMTREGLTSVGWRPFAQGLSLWAVTATLSLLAILTKIFT